MIAELFAAAVCISTPECAVRELRPWSDKVLCYRMSQRRWRCLVAMRNGHAFRYRVERRFDAALGAEYVGGYLIAQRVRGTWQISR